MEQCVSRMQLCAEKGADIIANSSDPDQAAPQVRVFKRRSQGLPMWSKGVLDNDSGVCYFKKVQTIAKILIILALLTRNTSKYESIDKTLKFWIDHIASLRTLTSNF